VSVFSVEDRERVRDRVLVLPGCLQLDVSATPASAFGAGGPSFRLPFGEAVDNPHAQPPR
jgi:hypothetical protein